jgi:hypothetical protein
MKLRCSNSIGGRQMNGRLGKLILGGLVFVSTPCWAAESLINGEQLQYNYTYHCAGEQVIVGHCYDNDDNSMCQTYYPDRPKYHGYEITKAEKRGDIIARLDACYRPPSAAEIAAGTDRLKKALGVPTDTAPRLGNAAPGLGHARWSMLYMDDYSATYFVPSQIKRTGASGSGWFTTVYLMRQKYPGANLAEAEFMQARTQADCSNGLLKAPDFAAYDGHGKLLAARPDSNAKWDNVDADSAGERKLNILCGRPQPLAQKAAIIGNGDDLMANTMRSIANAMQAADDARTKSQ